MRGEFVEKMKTLSLHSIVACCITESADTHCKYVMLIAFRGQKLLCVYMDM